MVALPPAAPITGEVVSTLVLLWVTVPLVLPQPSIALQLRVVTKVHAFPEVVSPRFCTVAPLHVSDTVGAVKLGEAGHSTVLFAPGEPIVGAVVSTLVLVWVTVPLVLPQPSTALQLRVVTKVHAFPEVVSPRFCTVAPLHVSDAVGAVNDGEAGHSTVLFAPGEPIVGLVVSTLVLVWVTVPLVLPQPSTALQLRVVTKVHAFPEVVSPRFCTVAPLHVSDAVGAVNDGEAGHSTVLFAPGEPIVGLVVSTLVLVWVTVPLVLPQPSTALQLRVVTKAHAFPEVVSPRFCTVAPLHVSDTVGAVNDGEAGHSTVLFAPGEPIVGLVVSTLVLRWVTVPLVLPQPSTALQLRVVTKVHEFPEVVSPRFCTVAPLHVSDTVGAVNDGEAGHSTVLSAPGEPIVGLVVSTLVLPSVTAPLVFPQPSTPLQLRVLTKVHEFPDVVSPRFCTVAP